MYSKQDEANSRNQFWTRFGQYLAPIPSACGDKINWINYKTGVRHIQFKMDATNDHAYIGIEILHPDKGMQDHFYKMFLSMRQEFENTVLEKWVWEESVVVQGEKISRISNVLHHVNINQQADWPGMISFLKAGIISLDRFWNDQKDIFTMIG